MPKRRVDPDKASSDRGTAWSYDARGQALALVAEGVGESEIERRTGVPNSTVHDWCQRVMGETLTLLGFPSDKQDLDLEPRQLMPAFQRLMAKQLSIAVMESTAPGLTPKERKDIVMAAAIAYDKLALSIGLPTSRSESTKGAPSQVDLVSALRTLYNDASRSAAESVVIDITPSASAESTPKA